MQSRTKASYIEQHDSIGHAWEAPEGAGVDLNHAIVCAEMPPKGQIGGIRAKRGSFMHFGYALKYCSCLRLQGSTHSPCSFEGRSSAFTWALTTFMHADESVPQLLM